MASSAMVHNLCSVSPKCFYHKNKNLALSHSQFLSSPSFLRLKNKTLLSNIKFNKPLSPKPQIYALQSNFFKVFQSVWKVGKDGIEAGTSLVPDSVPRPIASISVAVVALTVTLFVLKSVLSTAFFALVRCRFVLLPVGS
ncbi:hypothetical protein COLO4_36853 [Corchorus olitorius]|uniref:Uncharacterized protein n=1 Tax=Corchorus olitorius TaxID=93759 RepID=A0A1R3G4T9_9ROSI|nr:hypothetical protein COLO4_36853 [Corchorus olitorius]